MDNEDIWDLVGEWEYSAVIIHLISEYDPESMKVRHSPYKLQRLPDNYLANIFNGASASSSSSVVPNGAPVINL